MTTYTQNYGSLTVGTIDPLTFQAINLTETDTVTGAATITNPFATSAGTVEPFSQNPPSEIGFGWGGLILDDFSKGGSSSQLLDFTYNVTADAPGELVSAVAPIYAIDYQSGGGRMLAIENVYDSSNNLIGSNTFDTNVSTLNTTTTLTEAVQTAHVQLTIDLTTAAAGDEIAASIIAQDFLQTAGTTTPVPSVSIDKQISANGGATWLCVGDGVLNGPTVLAGSTLEERVIVTNTGSVALSNLSVGDVGPGPGSFAVGSSLAVGASETSAVQSFVATGTVEQIDTATVTGVGVVSGSTISVSASDVANDTPEVPSISIDKQISPNGGTTWLDVGSGVLNDPIVLAGTTMEVRVIVTNTGSVALTNLSVTDVGAGPAGFTLSSSTLAAGASETSAVGTFVATGTIHQYDTATVTGTATDTYGNSTTVTANDTADFTPEVPSVSLDKQISANGGTTWVDVGVGVLNDPTVLAGTTLEERVIVTNTGSMTLTNLSVSDVGAGPASFAVGSTLAAGASETSAVGTFVATGTIHQYDTATVTGTATDTYGNSTTVTATDTADFTPVSPAVSLDKQISPNGGTTWLDVGVGVLNDPIVLAGTTLEERVIVTNTGSVALTNLSVSDVGAGPASFTLSSSTLAVGGSETSAIGTYVATGTVHQYDTATVTGTATVGGTPTTVTATDTADFTPVSPAVSLDKQISPNGGTTWLDVGAGVLNDPIVLAGTTLEERVIVTNTGSVALTNLSVSDVGAGPASFTLSSSTLAVGGSETSAIGTYVATGTVHQYDTATVTGTATDTYGNSRTVTANDTADFTPASPAVSLDKQISTDGTTWLDVGVGNLTQDPVVPVGSTVYERVIVTNTGSLALTSLTVSDVGGNGPASFAVGSTLAVGGSEISAVATISAAVGYQLDTATVTGTGSDSYGHSQSVTASDQANYTGASSELPSTTSLVIIKVPSVTAIAECGCGGGSGGSSCGGSSSCGGGSGGGSCGSGSSCGSGQGGGSSCGDQGQSGGSSCGGSSQGGGSSCGGSGQGSGGSSCGDQNWGSFCGGSSGGGSCQTGQGSSGSNCGSNQGSSGGSSCQTGQGSSGSDCGQGQSGGGSCQTGSSGGSNCDQGQSGGSSCGSSGQGSGGSSCGDQNWGSFCGGSSGGGSNCGSGQSGGDNNCGSGGGSNNCGSGGSGNNNCGQGGGNTCSNEGVTYTYTVENTGTTTLYNVTVTDVVNGGTTETFTDSSPLAAGATWTFTDTTYANTLPPLNSPADTTAYGSTDVATATATTGSSTTSTAATPANTEARVQIGNAATGDTVQIGGTAPTGNVFTDFTGKAAVIEFNYTPAGNTVSTAGQGTGSTIATSAGSTPTSPAFIIVDNVASDSTTGATLYFEGTVKSGMDFYADSTVNPLTGLPTGADFPTASGDFLYAHIFTSEAAWQAGQAATQEIKYSVTGGSAVDIGDTIGSLKVVGYVSTTNQGFAV